jgi:hypothetical protein
MADEFKSKPLNSLPKGGTIISVGADPELLTLREAMLQKAGFKVVSTDAKHSIWSSDVVIMTWWFSVIR